MPLFVDKKNKTAERFEPNGYFYESSSSLNGLYQKADAAIRGFFENFGLIYIPSLDICPANGVQLQEQDGLFFGFCSTWSVWYMDMRLTYPDDHPWDLNQAILMKVRSMSTDALQGYIKAYVSRIFDVALTAFPQFEREIRGGIDPNESRHSVFIDELD